MRKVRMRDVEAAASWHFGTGLGAKPASRRVIEARRCAYAACRELGFTWNEIATAFDRDRTTVIYALSEGRHLRNVDPEDKASVLANARARALADSSEELEPVGLPNPEGPPIQRHAGVRGLYRSKGYLESLPTGGDER